jgi:hypothetical protein
LGRPGRNLEINELTPELSACIGVMPYLLCHHQESKPYRKNRPTADNTRYMGRLTNWIRERF